MTRSASSSHRFAVAMIVVALATCVVYQFMTLTSTSLWLDEIMELEMAHLTPWPSILDSIPADKPPLDYLLVKLVSPAWESDFWARTPSAFFGCLLIVAIISGGVRLDPRREQGWLFALVWGLLLLTQANRFHISQQLLPYSQALFWTTLFALAIERLLDSPLPTERPRRFYFLVLVVFVSMAAATLTIYLSVLILGVILIGGFAAAVRKWDKVAAKRITAFIVLLVPVAFYVFMALSKTDDQGYPWGFSDSPAILFRDLLYCLNGFRANSPLGWTGAFLEAALFVVGLAYVLRFEMKRAGSFIFGAWLFLGFPVIVFLYYWKDHWLLPRYFVNFSVPITYFQAMGVLALGRMAGGTLPENGGTATEGAKRRINGVFVIGLAAAMMLVRYQGLQTVRAPLPPYRQTMAKWNDEIGGRFPISFDETEPIECLALVDHDTTQYCYESYRYRQFPELPPARVFKAEDRKAIRHILDEKTALIFPVYSDTDTSTVTLRMTIGAARPFEETTILRLAPESLSHFFPMVEAPFDLDMNRLSDFFLTGLNTLESWQGTPVCWLEHDARMAFRVARPGRYQIKWNVFPQKHSSAEPRTVEISDNFQGASNHRPEPLLFTTIAHVVEATRTTESAEDDIVIQVRISSPDVIEIASDPRDLSLALHGATIKELRD